MLIRPLSVELQNVAKKELNEDSKRILKDINYIQDWILKQPHLNVKADDQWVLTFLRGCKFSYEKTKQKLDTFYTNRSIIPEFYSDRDPFRPEIQEVLELGLCIPLTRSIDPDSPRIIIFRNGAENPNRISLSNIFKVTMMIFEILMIEDDNFNVSGHIIIEDVKGLGFGHVKNVTPALIKKLIMCFQEGYPSRPKGVHIINVQHIFESAFCLVKPLLSSKLKKRIHIHSSDSLDELHKAIPKSVLPKEYGGEMKTFSELAGYWKKKVESYSNWFLEQANYRSDENKRRDQAKSSETTLGMDGSFRQLNVD